MLRKFKVELFRFKIIEYNKGEYLWKPGELSGGIIVVLRGSISFLIKAEEYLLPIYLAGKGELLGMEHAVSSSSAHLTYA